MASSRQGTAADEGEYPVKDDHPRERKSEPDVLPLPIAHARHGEQKGSLQDGRNDDQADTGNHDFQTPILFAADGDKPRLLNGACKRTVLNVNGSQRTPVSPNTDSAEAPPSKSVLAVFSFFT
jgi:hypothetical protein